MISMFSSRFQRKVVLTRHARDRMAERNITEMMLMEVIDSGETRYRDSTHLWAYKEFPERNDNLLCAVLVLEDAVVVKTVMHHFSLN
jgi:predicted oxidoreductase (fatty acid repression mutant protein)